MKKKTTKVTSLLSCRLRRRRTGSVAVLPCQGHRTPVRPTTACPPTDHRRHPPLPLLHRRCTRSQRRRHRRVFIHIYTHSTYIHLITYKSYNRQRCIGILHTHTHMWSRSRSTRTVKGSGHGKEQKSIDKTEKINSDGLPLPIHLNFFFVFGPEKSFLFAVTNTRN